MRLDKIDPPFADLYDTAYVYVNNEGRRLIKFIKDKKHIKGMAYARYLLSVKLGRFLTDDEQVDHIDNDKTNDSIDNLQILTPKANTDKYQATLPHNVHGTNSMYRKGCRCAVCKAWRHDYTKKYYERNPDKRAALNEAKRRRRKLKSI